MTDHGDQPWPAPAKLNLMLRIVGRREDGYHAIQTVFQFLDYCDRIRFRLRHDGVIRRVSGLDGVDPDQDLAIRAARCIQRFTGGRRGVDIRVDKRIPVGGGLGGGSSDAATTLVALNHLWGAGLDPDGLADLGLELGADVPVFVRGFAAWGEGVGERLSPVELREPWYLVLVPPCTVSTAAVFSAPELTRDSRPITIADFLAGSDDNDCLPVVRERYPVVNEALDWLARFSRPRLTGTGACVYAEFDDESQARKVLRERPAHLDGFVARGLNRSPLLKRVNWGVAKR